MIAIRLPAEIESRLDALVRETGRTKSFTFAKRLLNIGRLRRLATLQNND